MSRPNVVGRSSRCPSRPRMLPTKATRLPPDQPAVKHRETFMPITVDVPQRTDAFPAPTNRSLSRRRFGTMALASGAAAWLSSLSAQAAAGIRGSPGHRLRMGRSDTRPRGAGAALLASLRDPEGTGPAHRLLPWARRFAKRLQLPRRGVVGARDREPAHPARRQRPDALGGQPDTAPRPSRWGSGRAGSHRADAGREVRPRPPAPS